MPTLNLIVGDGDLVLIAGGLVAGRDIEDTDGVDVECDLNLRNSPWGRRDTDTGKVELPRG